MSTTLEVIRGLVAAGELRISEHGYDEFRKMGSEYEIYWLTCPALS